MEVREKYDDYWKMECPRCSARVGIWRTEINPYTQRCWTCEKIKAIEYHPGEAIIVYENGTWEVIKDGNVSAVSYKKNDKADHQSSDQRSQ